MAKGLTSTAVLEPIYGLYLGRPSISVPTQALEDALNIRIRNKKISSFGMGWEAFTRQNLGGPVTLMDVFFHVDGSSDLITGTYRDLYVWDVVGSRWRYINQRYEVGTANCAGASTAVAGAGGTLWLTNGVPVRAGDEISFGATGRKDISDTWYPIASVGADNALTLAINGPNTGGAVAYTIRQRFNSANLNNFWRSETFPRGDVGGVIKDRWYATNGGVDNIVRFDAGADQVVQTQLGAGGFKCKTLLRASNMMLYLNDIDNSGTAPIKPQSFKNSDVGKPDTMAGGLSGEFIAAPKTGAILAASAIGDNFALFTDNEVVLAAFVGSPNIWAFRTVVTGTGLIAPRLLSQFTDTIQFMGRDALYNFNGIGASSVDDHVWQSVIREQDQNRIFASHTYFDEENGQLAWIITKTSDANPTLPTNLAPYSEHFDAVLWTKTRSSISSINSTADPITGLITADTLKEDGTAGNNHIAAQLIAKAAVATTYTASVYVARGAGTRNVGLQLSDGVGNGINAFFNLGTVVANAPAAFGAGFTVLSSAITAVGSYFRVSLSFVSNAAASVNFQVTMLDATMASVYNGDNVSSLILFGAQLENTSALGTYLQATTTARTAITDVGPALSYEASYLETMPTGVPTPYTKRQFPFTIAGFYADAAAKTWASLTSPWSSYSFAWGDRILSAAFPLVLTGDVTGRVWKMNTVDTQDGAGYASYATFGRRYISDFRSRNLLRRIYISTRRLASATYALTTTTSLYDHPDSLATSNTVLSFGLSLTNDPWLPVYRRGRVGQLQVGTPGSTTGQPWELWGYDWDILPGGKR